MTRWASVAVALYTAVVLTIAIGFHPTPLYSVETDLTGEYIPAAHELAAGRLTPEHYAFHGPGYPLLLAAVAPLAGHDYFLAARVLTAVSSGLAAWFAFLIVLEIAGGPVAALMLAGLLVNSTFVHWSVESGTDSPALAIALFVTWCVVRRSGPWTALLAGLGAGFAVVIRYNMAFLIPAAVLVLLRSDRRRLIWVVAGAALPIAAWCWLNARLTGDSFHSNNHLLIAYELYGHGLPGELFEAQMGDRFHSLADVIAFDPVHAVLRIATNVCVRFGRDLVELMPPWLGWLALPGLFLVARRRAWRPALIHFACASLALAPVFYSSRFALYLLPFYLAAIAALLIALPDLIARWLPRIATAAVRPVVAATTVALLLGSGIAAGRAIHQQLAEAPHEVRIGGQALAALGLQGQRIVARKPQIAYFAGMQYVPMGLTTSVNELVRSARDAGARYCFYSAIEQMTRPECAVLGDSGLALPGLRQIAYRRLAPGHFYAIYRIDRVVDDSTMRLALVPELLRYADRHRGELDAQLYAALQLLNAERYRDALDRLTALRRSGVKHAVVASLASTAYLGLGDYEQSYRECELAMRLGPATAWHYERLGSVREAQHRPAEAQQWYERAAQAGATP